MAGRAVAAAATTYMAAGAGITARVGVKEVSAAASQAVPWAAIRAGAAATRGARAKAATWAAAAAEGAATDVVLGARVGWH